MNLNDVLLEIKKREDVGETAEVLLQSIKSMLEEYQCINRQESKLLDKLINDMPEDYEFNDNSTESKRGNKVYFRNIEERLICEIRKADVVLGAVAWVKKDEIIDALAEKDNVFIVIDKNPMFKSDYSKLSKKDRDERNKLIKKYKNLTCNLSPYQFDNLLNKVSEDCSPIIEPIKCVGKEKTYPYSLMHNKFLIFARMIKEKIEMEEKVFYLDKVKPYAVWTGSFNLTFNATQSLENALLITDEEIVNAYFKEFGQIAAISEKLLWDSPLPNPDWKFT
ncbi:phospholipase D-like domain-containing protein [Vibrio owensii]|uniref:phospholipase D-like domain-containing protein n=1 Tax=Vibrio owensii TaxID=696485 RepID=UPI000B1401DC|nr:phospholipase D-like domain-containing protein [Vibrio owensii]